MLLVKKEKTFFNFKDKNSLTLSWWRSPSYRNQSIDFQSKLMDWFLYDRDLRQEIVKLQSSTILQSWSYIFETFWNNNMYIDLLKPYKQTM